MFYIELEYNGKVYKTKPTDEITLEEGFDKFWKNFEAMNKIHLNLEDGSKLLAGKDIVQGSIVRFVPYVDIGIKIKCYECKHITSFSKLSIIKFLDSNNEKYACTCSCCGRTKLLNTNEIKSLYMAQI